MEPEITKEVLLPAVPPPPVARPQRLIVGESGEWFEVPPRPRIDLSRRRSMRALFEALLRERLDRPGHALPMRTLAQLGWPHKRTHPELAAGRVYTAIKTLRQMGLTGLLVNREDGYLLDPDAPRSSEIVTVCSMCKKLKISHEQWVDLEEGLARLKLFEADKMPQLSHGLCGACHEAALKDIKAYKESKKARLPKTT